MIIKEEQSNKLTPFRVITIGAIFQSGNTYYIKIEPIREDVVDKPFVVTSYNAVALDSGRAVFFNNDTMMMVKPHATLLPDGEI